MRILHVAPSIARAYGGPVAAIAGFADAALRRGISVDVAAPDPGPAERDCFAAQLPGAGLHLFRAVGRGAQLLSPALLRWLGGAARGYDVVHVHGLMNPVSSLASSAVARGGQPLVIAPFGMLSRYTMRHRRTALKRVYMRLLEYPSLRRAAGVHFTTSAEAAEARWHGIDLEGRDFVVPPPWLGAGAERPRVARPPRAGRVPTVLFLSRLHPVKSLETLLDAWPLVLHRLGDARLVVAGDGEASYVSALRARAMQMEAGRGTVEFRGFVTGDDKDACLDAADLFVLPSQHENFGVAVVEAIVAGVPVVVSPEVQLAPFVAEHRLGVVAERRPEALADAIVRALGDEPLRERVARCGAAAVHQHFSPEVVGARLVAMYERVTGAA